MSGAQCFYPNGSPSLEEDIPCGSGDAVACCPLNWICQNNGLCYLPDQNYYGRYTCTGRAWDPGCPEICTYDHSAGGNEAVLECEPGSYCCDTNRPELSGGINCCDASTVRFTLDGTSALNSTSEEPPQPTPSEEPPQPTPSEEPSQPTPSQEPPEQSSSDERPEPSSSSTAEPSSFDATSVMSSRTVSTICDAAAGETSCGFVCCTTGQYCDTQQCATIGGTLESNTVAVTSEVPSSSTVESTTSVQSEVSPGATAAPTTAVSSALGPSTMTTSFLTPTDAASPSTFSAGGAFFTTTSTAAARPTETAAPDFVDTTPGKVAISVSVVIGGLLLIALSVFGVLRFIKWRKNRPKPPYEPSTWTNGGPGMGDAPTQSSLLPAVAPYPHPYTEAFPLNQGPPGSGQTPMTSQSHVNQPSSAGGQTPMTSQSNFFTIPPIAPDHDPENQRRSSNITLPPTQHQNPYAQDRVVSPPPSYRSQDPNPPPIRRGQQHRRPSRTVLREPGIPEFPGQ